MNKSFIFWWSEAYLFFFFFVVYTFDVLVKKLMATKKFLGNLIYVLCVCALTVTYAPAWVNLYVRCAMQDKRCVCLFIWHEYLVILVPLPKVTRVYLIVPHLCWQSLGFDGLGSSFCFETYFEIAGTNVVWYWYEGGQMHQWKQRHFKDRQKSVRSLQQINYSKEYWSLKVLFAFHSLVWLIRTGVCLFAQDWIATVFS